MQQCVSTLNDLSWSPSDVPELHPSARLRPQERHIISRADYTVRQAEMEGEKLNISCCAPLAYLVSLRKVTGPAAHTHIAPRGSWRAPLASDQHQIRPSAPGHSAAGATCQRPTTQLIPNSPVHEQRSREPSGTTTRLSADTGHGHMKWKDVYH